jgi:hypothetical protein
MRGKRRGRSPSDFLCRVGVLYCLLEGLDLAGAVEAEPGRVEARVLRATELVVYHVGDRVEGLPPGAASELGAGLSLEDAESLSSRTRDLCLLHIV